MATIPSNTFKVWRDGDVVGAEEYMKELEILRMAINANGADLSTIKNATAGVLKGVLNGATFPPNPNVGDLFFRTDEGALYVLNAESNWTALSLSSELAEHTVSTENPHKVSASQIGVYTKEEARGEFAAQIQEAEKYPTLMNQWKNAYTEQKARYWKDTLGMVHINGRVNLGIQTDGTTLFILPAGYRPKEQYYENKRNFDIAIFPTGEVKLYSCQSNADNGLDNIHFRAYN